MVDARHSASDSVDFVAGKHWQVVRANHPLLFGAHPPHVALTLDHGLLAVDFDDVLFHLLVGVVGFALLFLFFGQTAHQCPNRAMRLV